MNTYVNQKISCKSNFFALIPYRLGMSVQSERITILGTPDFKAFLVEELKKKVSVYRNWYDNVVPKRHQTMMRLYQLR